MIAVEISDEGDVVVRLDLVDRTFVTLQLHPDEALRLVDVLADALTADGTVVLDQYDPPARWALRSLRGGDS